MEAIDYKTEARPARPSSHPLLQDWEHISLLIDALHQKKRSHGQLSSPSHRSVLVTLWKWIGPSVVIAAVLGCTFGFRSILKPLEDYKAIGQWYHAQMPDGTGQWGLYKGSVQAQRDLPANGNRICDMYQVRDDGHEYIWLVSPVTNTATWVDP
jgi:hypothetical protein